MRSEKTVIVKNDRSPRNRILIVTPTLGLVRAEWASARWGQIIPCNWSSAQTSLGLNSFIPMGYLVADAQNIGVDEVITKDFEWMFLHEDDVILPGNCFLKLNDYMKDGTIPIVSGLYFTKSIPSEPLVYRGRGNSCFVDWKMGTRVWADGVPTGCLLIHNSILRVMWKDAPVYNTFAGRQVRKVFETPGKCWQDPQTSSWLSQVGTSDLDWCDQIMDKGILKKAGWPKIAKKRYPFLIDTGIFCKHADLNTGKQYPENGLCNNSR